MLCTCKQWIEENAPRTGKICESQEIYIFLRDSPSLCTPKHKKKKDLSGLYFSVFMHNNRRELRFEHSCSISKSSGTGQYTFIILSLFIVFCPVLPGKKKKKNASLNPAGILIPLTLRQINAPADQCKKHFPQVYLGLLVYLCAKGYFHDRVSGSKWPLWQIQIYHVVGFFSIKCFNKECTHLDSAVAL